MMRDHIILLSYLSLKHLDNSSSIFIGLLNLQIDAWKREKFFYVNLYIELKCLKFKIDNIYIKGNTLSFFQ